MHVRGFTKDPSSGLPKATRGTYSGVIEKIQYLQELGVTAVELMPVFQFRRTSTARQGTFNYLGLRTGLVLRAAPGVQLAAGPARSSRRVPRHGESTAPGRHRSDS